MSAAMVAVNLGGLRSPVSAARIKAAAALVLRAQKAEAALLSITMLGRVQMTAMNRRHFRRRGATDVISFGFRDPQGAVIGDVYICPSVAADNAKEYGVSVREEILRLVVHGTLHALGHDHPEGNERTRSGMWRIQERLLARVLPR